MAMLQEDVSNFYQEKPITYVNLQSRYDSSFLTGINYKKVSLSKCLLNGKIIRTKSDK